MRARRGAARGAAMVYALAVVMVLAVFATYCTQLSLHRAVLVEHVASGSQGVLQAKSLATKLNDCLANVSAATCNAATLAACRFPSSIDGRPITITVSWVNSTCRSQVTIQ